MEYKNERQILKKLARKLEKLSGDFRELSARIRDIPGEIREAHIPLGLPIPLTYFVDGPIAYFQRLPDPASQLVNLSLSMSDAVRFLEEESRRLKRKAPRIKALWKTKPIIWYQKGGLEYTLDSFFRRLLRLTVRKSHKRIMEIRRKLDGSMLSFDEEKGYAPAIRRTIENMSKSYKLQCDLVIDGILRRYPQ